MTLYKYIKCIYCVGLFVTYIYNEHKTIILWHSKIERMTFNVDLKKNRKNIIIAL
jgi:hypothetical protein